MIFNMFEIIMTSSVVAVVMFLFVIYGPTETIAYGIDRQGGRVKFSWWNRMLLRNMTARIIRVDKVFRIQLRVVPFAPWTLVLTESTSEYAVAVLNQLFKSAELSIAPPRVEVVGVYNRGTNKGISNDNVN